MNALETLSGRFASAAGTARPSSPYLLVVGGSAAGSLFKLEKSLTTIGRASDCDVQLDDEGISRCHAALELDAAGGFELADRGSKNGCYYRGERFMRRRLADGDKVQLGPRSVVKLTYQDAVEEAFYREQHERVTRCGLTGAFRKEHFAQQLARDFAFAKRHGEPLGLILLDIDHFKNVNDVFGHAAGDRVLRRVADVLREALRVEDVLARVGGEEFAALLRRETGEGCVAVAERLRAAVAAIELVVEGARVPVTISLGVASLEQGAFAEPEGLLEAADRRLYAAKRGGRNRVVHADPQAPGPEDLQRGTVGIRSMDKQLRRLYALDQVRRTRARLVVAHDALRTTIPIDRLETVVGRRPESDVALGHLSVSATHATLAYGDGGFAVIDRGSTNGSCVDGAQVPPATPVRIEDYTAIGFGAVSCLFVCDAARPSVRRARSKRMLRHLVRTGVLTRAQSKDLLGQVKEKGQRLGEAIVLRGFLAPERWVEILRAAELHAGAAARLPIVAIAIITALALATLTLLRGG